MSDLLESNSLPIESTVEAPAGDLSGEAAPAKTIDDELRETYARIQADDAPKKPESEAKPAVAERARDESGKFVKTEAEKAAEQAITAAKPGEAKAFEDKGAPNTWRATAKAQWASLPQFAKEEAYKREADFFNGMQQYQAKAQVADTLVAVVQPYQPILNALGADIPTALSEVLKTAAIFHVGTPAQKVAALKQIAQTHGIDMGTQANSPADQFADPALEQLQRELAEVKGLLAGQSQATQNSVISEASSQITAFANDPANKYFSDVRVSMGRLITSGESTSMKDAYERACWSNPQVRAAMELERGQEAEAKSAKERADRAASARRAGSLAVRSTPLPVQSAPSGKWDDPETMRATYRSIVGAEG